MRIVTVRIEDNTEKINRIRELKDEKFETVKNISDEIDRLQEEAFMQILAYVKCAYEDYVNIVGLTTPINDVSWIENRFDVSNISRSLRICVRSGRIFIDFNYTGTLNCKNTPPRMEAKFNNDIIIIKESTREGIRDLMLMWDGIKPEFQKKIDKAYNKQVENIKSDIENLECLLKVAKKFKDKRDIH